MQFFNTVGGRLLTLPVLTLGGFLLIAIMALSALQHRLMEGREQRVFAVIDIA